LREDRRRASTALLIRQHSLRFFPSLISSAQARALGSAKGCQHGRCNLHVAVVVGLDCVCLERLCVSLSGGQSQHSPPGAPADAATLQQQSMPLSLPPAALNQQCLPRLAAHFHLTSISISLPFSSASIFIHFHFHPLPFSSTSIFIHFHFHLTSTDTH
jgi:hypothetical protein